MFLHTDKNLFEQTILKVSQVSNIETAIIEKDYYVTLLLKELHRNLPFLVFKGGTSLSKCHKIIKRFSEDIDITLDEKHLTQGNRKSVKFAIEDSCKKYDFLISNLKDIRSRMNYNNYKIEYPGIFTIECLKPDIEVDTIFSIKSFPYKNMNATSIIYDVLQGLGHDEFISQYNLEPFEVYTQTIERTFVDKIFALCDYYLEGKNKEKSRHLYDIFKIYPLIDVNFNLKRLIIDTRQARIESPFCVSADMQININDILQKIIDTDYYKMDYKENTSMLLYEKVSYDEVKTNLQKIVVSKIF